jgi:hypothetical protein
MSSFSTGEFAVQSHKIPSATQDTVVARWFGRRFEELHPLIQQLHTDGGGLTGKVKISYGKGFSGLIGRRLGKKMNLPSAGLHRLVVNISHDHDALLWSRCFNGSVHVQSEFKPVGDIDRGYWIEETGPLTMHLKVDIHQGGWFWRCVQIRLWGLPIPRWLIPMTSAYKRIENNQYRFHVSFTYPALGTLVSYQGLLSPQPN